MKKLLSILLLLLLLSAQAKAQNASIVDTSLNPMDLYFTGDANDPRTWYQDAMGNNPDATIMVCGVGPKYVGAVYAANILGSFKYVLITYRSSTEALAYTDKSSGNCFYPSHGYLVFSPSFLSTPDPNVYYAAFPGRICITYSTSSNPGTLNNFILTNRYLRGDYSFSRSFDENTNMIRVNTPTIIFDAYAYQVSKQANDPLFGVNSERRMVVGICSDSAGENCYSGAIIPSEGNFPISLSSGASPINDQNVYNRYIVLNGIGKRICIGANLQVTINSISPDPVYYSQNLTINLTVRNKLDTPTEENGGNVKVTTPFYLRFKIYRVDNSSNVVYDTNYLITSILTPDAQVPITISWPAYAKSGEYKFEVTADVNNNIKECNENDNTALTTFTLKPIIIPKIFINGNETNKFPFAGVPYNLTIRLKDSDDLDVSNATVRIIEENGIGIFSPFQVWSAFVNNTTSQNVSTKITNIVEFKTDYYGNASITLIPTGNPLYAPQYSYIDIKNLTGDYSIRLEGKKFDNETFVFVIESKVINSYPLYVENYYSYENITSLLPIQLPNFETFVDAFMSIVYTIFAKFWKMVTT
jgi:hypothetical protein